MTTLFELVAHDLSGELVLPDLIGQLAERVRGQPARSVGFECRLGPDEQQVDVQLGWLSKHDEPRVLRAHSQKHDGVVWQRVLELCERWTNVDSPITRTMSEVWLEFDPPRDTADNSVTTASLPSVFATLSRAEQGVAQATLPAIREILEALAPTSTPHTEARSQIIERFVAACPHPAFVSHVGVMLGRDVPAVRLHVSLLPFSSAPEFLKSVGWNGDVAEALRLARLLLEYTDTVVFCFDVLEGRVLPRLGLEFFFDRKGGVDPRWPLLLSRLVELGLAAPSKAEALIQWPGLIIPPQVAGEWPHELIVESLRRPQNWFGTIERRLSHVKLTVDDAVPHSAKAYFGAVHLWERFEDFRTDPVIVARPRRPASTLSEATHAAVNMLCAGRNQAGWWKDFHGLALVAEKDQPETLHNSEEWSTAYIGAALAVAPGAGSKSVASSALAVLLERRLDSAGWGYHPIIASDADSTAWVLRLAAGLEWPRTERLARAEAFLRGHIDQYGGVATYLNSDRPEHPAAPRSMPRDGHDGWCSPHTCVTAAVAGVGLSPLPKDYLIKTQRGDGSWGGYWWYDDEYTTALAAEALGPDVQHRHAVRRAARWAAERIGPDGCVVLPEDGVGSAFATALVVRTITASRVRDAVEEAAANRGLRWLLEHQRVDGSWAPSARMRVPPPDMLESALPVAGAPVYLDESALFTTATVLSALSGFAAERSAVR